jgi:hypothetical protein
VKQAFAHDATLIMNPESDYRAPGAAVTVGLCGSWEHPPPCPLAQHHTTAQPAGRQLPLRILFATEPSHEVEVRDRIDAALRQGHLTGPDGSSTHWQFENSRPGIVQEQEAEHARRLLQP